MDAFPTPSAIKQYDKATIERAPAILDPVLSAARARGLTCNGVHAKDTHAAEAILKTSRECGCDLIIMASHGYGSVRRFLLGSVATEVLTGSSIPVMIFKCPPQHAAPVLRTRSPQRGQNSSNRLGDTQCQRFV